MSLHRFFLQGALPASGQPVDLALSSADRHHLERVLRLGARDRIAVVGADGLEAEATLVAIEPDRVVATLSAPVPRSVHPRVALAAAISRRERMELAIQKATELGVVEVLPVATARCVVRLDDRKAAERAERWRRIALEAAKQSQRADVPIVGDPVTLGGLLDELRRFDIVLVPWEEATGGAPGIGAALAEAGARPDSSVLVVIGPEGGLEATEVEALKAAGGIVVTLGDTVLRTETACIVAVTLAAYELGGLGGRGR